MTDTGLFANESAPYAPFKTVGTEYSGIIVRKGKTQGRKYLPKSQRDAGKQGELETWPDGRPKWVYIVTLQTDLHDPSIPGDDGQRSLWIKGKQMEDAVKKAVRESGASREGLIEGGWLSLKFTHEVPNEDEDLAATKFYEATYRPPAPSAHTDDPWANGPTQQNPWGQTPQPAYAQGGHVRDGHIQDTAGLPAAAPNGTPATTPTTQQMLEKMLREQQGGTR